MSTHDDCQSEAFLKAVEDRPARSAGGARREQLAHDYLLAMIARGVGGAIMDQLVDDAVTLADSLLARLARR